MRPMNKIDFSIQAERFNKKDLENIKDSLTSSLYRADEAEEVMRYARTLVKTDDILKAEYKEE